MKESQSTQQIVDIEEIRDGVIILKNGGLRRILIVSGINFDLRSEEEQNIIIATYQSFLNSLDFSIQIIVHSRKLNIENYLQNLANRKETEKNELLKEQINEYLEFIRSFVASNEIMTKTFFVVVPYDPISVPKGISGVLESIPFLGKKKKSGAEENKTFEEKIQQLDQRTDQVTSGLSGVGLRAVVLNNEEAIELFYNLYNPQAIEKKELSIAKGE